MKAWLKGGLMGLFVGLILHLLINLGPLLFKSETILSTACYPCLFFPSRILIYFGGGFLIGTLVNLIITKIKSKKQISEIPKEQQIQ